LAYASRAAAYLEKGLTRQSISDCTKAIELNPNFAGAYVNRATAYMNDSRYDQAITDCRRAIRIDPTYTPAYATLKKLVAK
jgi:tetratricopeptide (TPR) repeat protein